DAVVTRPPGLRRVVVLTHFGVIGHIGGGRVGRLLGAVRPLLGGGLCILDAHALGIIRLRGVAFLALLVLIAVVAFVLLALVLVTHVERVDQLRHNVAETALVFDLALQSI